MLLMWDHVLIGYVYGIMYKLCLCLWDHVYYLDGLVLMGSCLWIGIMPEVTFLLRGCWSLMKLFPPCKPEKGCHFGTDFFTVHPYKEMTSPIRKGD